MKEPTIYYGTLQQPLHTDAQYLLMKAGIENGEISEQEFLDAIDGVSLDCVTKEECRRNVHNQRIFLRQFSRDKKTIRIEGFEPDEEKLESFVNTTFREAYEQLRQRG
ncbi:hypothetical protein ACFL96_12660 [Thermoproteota archaeon]